MRHSIIQIVNEFIKKVPIDTLRGIAPDIRGMLEEREYRKMEKLGQKHGIPIPGMFLRRQIFFDGEEILNQYGRSHTVNRNYYNLLFCQGASHAPTATASFGTGFLSVKDTGGTIRGDTQQSVATPAVTQATDAMARGTTAQILATAGTTAIGIVIGTSSAAEDFEGFALGTKIANGNGAGQMDYAQSDLHSLTNSVLTLKDTLIRDMNNNSGGSITVEEIAIYLGMMVGATTRQAMITRDLTGGDVVADAAQLRVTYEITLVYPS